MIRRLGLLLLLGAFWGCRNEAIDYHPAFGVGDGSEYHMEMSLSAGLPAEAPQLWSHQEMRVHFIVDSLGDSGSAYIHMTLDSLHWKPADRSTAETEFMLNRLKGYRSGFRMLADGQIRDRWEEPVLPPLFPAWVSPQRLLTWAWPAWSPSENHPGQDNPRPDAGADGDCIWDRRLQGGNGSGTDPIWHREVIIEPLFQDQDSSACLEPAWAGKGRLAGNPQGLGLKELYLTLTAKAGTGLELTQSLKLLRIQPSP